MRRLGVVAAGIAVVAAPGAAQYRDTPAGPPAFRAGQPDVLERPAAAPDPAERGVAAFRDRYARAGRPRVMLMWNKAFTDEVGSTYRDRLHVEEDSDAGATTTASVARTWYGAAGRQDGSARSHRTLDAVETSERVTGDRASPLDEGTDWRLESAFADEFAAAGVELVDHAAAMRAAGRSALGERPNAQAVEARAVGDSADLLVEIVQTADWASPMGALFRISVRSTRTSRLVALLTSSGRFAGRHMPFVAGPSGYVRAVAPPPSADAVGRQLARDVMASVAGRI